MEKKILKKIFASLFFLFVLPLFVTGNADYCNSEVACEDATVLFELVRKNKNNLFTEYQYIEQDNTVFYLKDPFDICLEKNYKDIFIPENPFKNFFQRKMGEFMILYADLINDYQQICQNIPSQNFDESVVQREQAFVDSFEMYCQVLNSENFEHRKPLCDILTEEVSFYYNNLRKTSFVFETPKFYITSIFDTCFDSFNDANIEVRDGEEYLKVFNFNELSIIYRNYCMRQTESHSPVYSFFFKNYEFCFGFCNLEFERLNLYLDNINDDPVLINEEAKKFLLNRGGFCSQQIHTFEEIYSSDMFDLDNLEKAVHNYADFCIIKDDVSLDNYDYDQKAVLLNLKLGNIFFENGDFKKAAVTFFKLVDLLDDKNHIHVEVLKSLLASLYHGGYCYTFLDVYDSSQIYDIKDYFDDAFIEKLYFFKEECEEKVSGEGLVDIFQKASRSEITKLRELDRSAFIIEFDEEQIKELYINNFDDETIDVFIFNSDELSEDEFFDRVEAFKEFVSEYSVDFEIFSEVKNPNARIKFTAIYEEDQIISCSRSFLRSTCSCFYPSEESYWYMSFKSFMNQKYGGDVFVILTSESCRSWAVPFVGSVVSWPSLETSFNEITEKNYKRLSEYVLIHELGHLIFGMDDEYTITDLSDSGSFPNCAGNRVSAETWWGDLSGNHSYLANDLSPYYRYKYSEFVGNVHYYAGCGRGNVRPVENSIMNDHHLYAEINETHDNIPFFFGRVNDLHMRNFLEMFVK